MRRSLAFALALSATACAPSADDTVPLPVGDLAFFADRVEPHLEERCGSAGCHGRPDRPFSIFSPGQHRRDASRTWLDEPLSVEEVEENARRTAAFALGDDPNSTLIVQKPLTVEDGGVWHGGGDVFYARSDVGCRALVSWLRGRALPVDGGLP